MRRRRLSLILNILLLILGVLLAVTVDYLANTAGVTAPALQLLQRGALPLLLIALLLIIVVQVWLYMLERPSSPGRVWDLDRPPYPGLESFIEQDAGVFFGRESQIAELLDRLHPTLPDEANRFVAVIGPSGAGKSSLVRAGLVPRLAQRRSRWVIALPLTPGEHPTASLAIALREALAPGHSASALVVIDQAEELLTRCGEQQRKAFLELLVGALRDNPRLWVVATLRSEFLTGFLTTCFADLFRNPVMIGALERAALFQVIEGPAAQAGLTFAPGVVNDLVDDTGGGDALPLLAYTLQALYLRVSSGGTVTVEDCRALGGVAGALSLQADKVAAELGPDVPVLATLLRFVTVDGAEPTRRRVIRSSLNDDERTVIDAFVSARLLTSDAEGDDAVIEVAHEALFRQWPPLRQAIEAQADDLRQRTELERWARDWVRSGRKDSYLLRDERLKIAQQWGNGNADLVAELPLVSELLSRSARSDRAALERLSDSVARRALASIDQDPEQGILLALAAIEECTPTRCAQQALLAALAACRVRSVLSGHQDGVNGVAWSMNGQRIATASEDGTARVWDARAGIELAVLQGHEDAVWDLAWSLDGQRIVTVSFDRTVRVWNLPTASEQAVLCGHEGAVWDVAWSPDGQRIVTVSSDRTVRVWNVEATSEEAVLRGHDGWVAGVAWSPDGQRIVTVSFDRTVRVWNLQTASEQAVLHGHGDAVLGVAWSPDGKRIATASRDRTARIWGVNSGIELAVLQGHRDWVWSVAWSPDGKRIATASGDRVARVWDVNSGIELAVLRGHRDWIRSVAWSPDGKRIATASHDRVARVWEVESIIGLAVLQGHRDWIRSVAWSPDGKRIVTASHDCTVRIWDAKSSNELAVLHGHEDGVLSVAWSPGGDRIATASFDQTARVWDAISGIERAVLRGHDGWVAGVAWSREGQRIATASHDRTARVWDAISGIECAVLRGHEDGVLSVAWSPGGDRIASASTDHTVRVWDAISGIECAVLRGHEDGVLSVAWSPGGDKIASASTDHTVRVWDAISGIECAVLRGHEDGVLSVAWSPDGQQIITASSDRTARLWDARQGIEVAVAGVHEDWIEDVAWSPDSRCVVTVSRDRTARVWDTDTSFETLVSKARACVFRELTSRERRSAMLPEVALPA